MMDLQLDTNVELSLNFFRSTFLHMALLLIGGLLSMVCEHFQDSFNLKDLISGFIQFYYLNSPLVVGHIP
jgi:hypothetical protein